MSSFQGYQRGKNGLLPAGIQKITAKSGVHGAAVLPAAMDKQLHILQRQGRKGAGSLKRAAGDQPKGEGQILREELFSLRPQKLSGQRS